MSKSSNYLNNKAGVPVISPNIIKGVSQYRREALEDEYQKGLITDRYSHKGSKEYSLTENSYVTASGNPIKKEAQVATPSGGYKGSNDASQQAPSIYSPLWLDSNLSLPRDRATINAWCRSFYVLNPFVHNAINLHSTYPISKLNIKCKNKKVENFFNEMCEEIDLMNVCVNIAQEYYLLGEAFPFAEYDELKGKWSRIVIQNPDYMVVKRTVVDNEPLIFLKPDDNLKRIATSNKAADIEQRKKLNPYIVDCILKGQNIPLDNFQVSHIARRISPYEIRGTGLPVCVFRQIMLFDRLRESKFAQADSMINPITLVKVGSENYKPTPADLEAWRSIFEQMQFNKDFKLFTHEGVDVQVVGRGQGIYDISGDITQLIKEILTGLQVPSVLMDGGSDTTYANGGVALDVLRQRYMQFRNMLANWLKRKIFAPISKIQDFYELEDGVKNLIVPDIDWNHMSLFDAGDYINNLLQLTSGEGGQKRVAVHELHRSLGFDFNDQMRKIKKEAIASEILKKETTVLSQMTLNELRALTDEDEIQEKDDGEKKELLPGESPEGAGGAPGEMPGLDLGAPPSLPPPPSESNLPPSAAPLPPK